MMRPSTVNQEKTPQKRQIKPLAAVLAVAIAAGGVAGGLIGGESQRSTSPNPYKTPKPRLYRKDSEKQINQKLQTANKAAAIITPNRASREYLQNYSNERGQYFTKPPKHPEVVQLQDNKAFSKKSREQTGLTVYNTTGKPVDVQFVHFAAESIQAWAQSKQRAAFRPNRFVEARLQTFDEHHDLMLTRNMPTYIADPEVPGATIRNGDPLYRGKTVSWIPFPGVATKGDNRLGFERGLMASDYNKYRYLGVELCQAMVKVDDAAALPGKRAPLAASQRFVGEQGNASAHSLDAFAQEITCNSLGRIITASYFGGESGVQRVVETDFQPRTLKAPLFDPAISAEELPTILSIRDQLATDPAPVYALQHTTSPTLKAFNSYY